MPLDRNKTLQSAERLLKQGKVKAAVSELQRITQAAPDDLLTLNRLGDLLARQGRHAEAIDHYNRIAERFVQGGFLPKAIAIYKKVLRLDPQNVEALVRLGDLYLQQQLTGEARTHWLQAAELHVKEQRFDPAREVYEKLVRAEPQDARHRVRLAEARAAAGQIDRAGADLLELGARLFEDGKPEEAQRIYERAAELLPQRAEPRLGIARCLLGAGREAEAIALLEQAAHGRASSPELRGELVLRYATAGRAERALEMLGEAECLAAPVATMSQIFRLFRERGEADRLWAALDGVLRSEEVRRDPVAAVRVLEAAAELEERGWVPALQRLCDVQQATGDGEGHVRALEWLVRAYQARSMHDEASLTLDRLRALAPDSAVLGQAEAVDAAELRESAESATPVLARAIPTNGGDSDPPVLPTSKADQEFVAGRLTQAEILEKYGLRQQALGQLREISQRFPGQIEAHERLVGMLRSGGGKEALSRALIDLALALRGAGDGTGARQAAEEAAELALLEPVERESLERLGLIAPTQVQQPTPRVANRSLERDSDEFVIDLDGMGEAEPAPAPRTRPASPARAAEPVERPASAPRGRPTRMPNDDMLDEIRTCLAQGEVAEARRRIEALATLGYASPALEALTVEVDQRLGQPAASRPAPAAAAAQRAPAARQERIPSAAHDDRLFDDEDLSAISAALEDELFETPAPEAPPQDTPDQSIDEIFAAFKQHVQHEVSGDDFRTHYDLGIAYKEMGLIDEAIGEFEIVTRAPEHYREATTMIALCHRQRNDLIQAARWYRQALEAANDDSAVASGLRYDLAEVLLQSGDAEGALDLFRDVLREDPSFRDVRNRISELEANLHS